MHCSTHWLGPIPIRLIGASRHGHSFDALTLPVFSSISDGLWHVHTRLNFLSSLIANGVMYIYVGFYYLPLRQSYVFGAKIQLRIKSQGVWMTQYKATESQGQRARGQRTTAELEKVQIQFAVGHDIFFVKYHNSND